VTPADPRPDAWLAEILGQPAAMERAATALVARADLLADLAAACRPGGHIVLTGMGSSAAACGAAATVLGGAGLLATPIETAELLHFRLPALAAGGTLVIISQSGAGAELLRLLDALASSPKRPFVVGVTNGDTNPLARRADLSFDTAAGAEVGPSSGTFAATLVTLAGIVRALGGGPGADAVAVAAQVQALAGAAARALEAVLTSAPDTAAALDAALAGRAHRVILGRGTARAAADVGALTLKEAAAFGCEAQDPAAFRHGPLELAGPQLGVVIVALDPATAPLDAALGAEIAAAGGGLVLIGPTAVSPGVATAVPGGAVTSAPTGVAAIPIPAGVTTVPIPAVDPLLAPALALAPLQLLAHRLAVRAGRRPGVFVRAAKVTTRE
jgi:glucosamine--fructose-6-phosphate aminotransferase (isomerizing)